MEPNHKHMTGLPLSLASPVDLGRVMRELEAISNDLQAMELRSPGQEVKMPKTSKIMDELVGLNKLNLLLAEDRKTLKQFLETIHKRAPRIHISFSADPSPIFVEKMMTWLREQLHPVVLLTVGLQPNIGAGCVVRTTNKYFDLSLAKDFEKKRDVLMSKLREGIAAPLANSPAVVAGMVDAPATPAEPTLPVAETAAEDADLAKAKAAMAEVAS